MLARRRVVSVEGYTTLFRQTLFVPTDAIPTVHSRDVEWLTQLNRPTGSTDWKDAEPNAENQGQYNNVLEVRTL